MKSDAALKIDVERELAWDTQIDDTAIGVAAHHGVVTLTGTVPCWADKHAIEEAAYRVHGVSSIANEIEIKPSWSATRSDADIAEAVRCALLWNRSIPAPQIRSTVSDEGTVTLTGAVPTLAQRDEAERIVREIAGVRYVANHIAVEAPSLARSEVHETIKQTLEQAPCSPTELP